MSTNRLTRRDIAGLVRLLDLTSLGDDDGPAEADRLLKRAMTPEGPVAALCLQPWLVAHARRELNERRTDVALATVANFPQGEGDIDQVRREIEQALSDGADEVDVVLPYRRLLTGQDQEVSAWLSACREAAGTATLKVILETGKLARPESISVASRLAIAAGADFIKTSTGKVDINATPEAAALMLDAIAEVDGRCGFKAAGGIRTAEQAQAYVNLARERLGRNWVAPDRFRIGASGLLDDLLGRLA